MQTQYVGEQLALGDESFWVGTQDVVVEAGDPARGRTSCVYSTAALLVLDGNVVTVIDDPAISDEIEGDVRRGGVGGVEGAPTRVRRGPPLTRTLGVSAPDTVSPPSRC